MNSQTTQAKGRRQVPGMQRRRGTASRRGTSGLRSSASSAFGVQIVAGESPVAPRLQGCVLLVLSLVARRR